MQVQKDSELNGYLDSVSVISHSKKTVSSYRTGVLKLRSFLTERYQSDELEIVSKIKKGEIEIGALLRDFVGYLNKKENGPRTIRAYLSVVKGYFRYLGIKFSSEDLKYIVKVPKIVGVREIPLTREMIRRLLHNCPLKLQTAILVALTSGLRISELVQLRITDIDFSTNPTTIHVRAETAKGKQARETFITSEATGVLKDYLTKLFGWKEGQKNEHMLGIPVFGRTNKGTRKINPASSATALQLSLVNYLGKIPDLSILNENKRRAIHFHGFRKYFRTTLGNVSGRDFAETLMGHTFYMSTYYNASDDKKRELYLKAESDLAISDTKVVEKNIKDLVEQYNILREEFAAFKQNARTNSVGVPSSLFH